MSKRVGLLTVIAPLIVVLVAVGREWVSGVTDDPLLGAARVSVSGAQAAPAVTALAVAIGAALLALLTGGRRIRPVAGLLLAGLACAVVVVVLAPLRDPAAVVASRAAVVAGRTGAVGASSVSVHPWAWVAGAGAGLLAVSGLLVAWSARRWSGLSARFDRPSGGGRGPGGRQTPGGDARTPGVEDRSRTTGSGRGARRTVWDELSDGHDPTRDDRTSGDLTQ